MPVRAVIFVPHHASHEQRLRWQDACRDHCNARRYTIVAIATVWADAEAMVRSGKADLKVAALPEHYPANRVPREEAVNSAPAGAEVPTPSQRRPRIQR
jgi:hypothetical protein